MRFPLAVLLLGIAVLACDGAQTQPSPGRHVTVLFIGNSLTYANDLPGMVAALAARSGDMVVQTSVSLPNYSLEDHWNDGRALQEISKGGWDVVVLQQGPSSLPASRVELVFDAERFAAEAAKVGARVALFSVWPSTDRLAFFDDVSASYAAAADSTDGLLFPAGEAWQAAWSRDPGLEFFSSDGFHPTELGSYLAALVIYQQLTGRSPEGLGKSFDWSAGHLDLTVSQSKILGESAAEANDNFARP